MLRSLHVGLSDIALSAQELQTKGPANAAPAVFFMGLRTSEDLYASFDLGVCAAGVLCSSMHASFDGVSHQVLTGTCALRSLQ